MRDTVMDEIEINHHINLAQQMIRRHQK